MGSIDETQGSCEGRPRADLADNDRAEEGRARPSQVGGKVKDFVTTPRRGGRRRRQRQGTSSTRSKDGTGATSCTSCAVGRPIGTGASRPGTSLARPPFGAGLARGTAFWCEPATAGGSPIESRTPDEQVLRCATWLAPGLPLELFRDRVIGRRPNRWGPRAPWSRSPTRAARSGRLTIRAGRVRSRVPVCPCTGNGCPVTDDLCGSSVPRPSQDAPERRPTLVLRQRLSCAITPEAASVADRRTLASDSTILVDERSALIARAGSRTLDLDESFATLVPTGRVIGGRLDMLAAGTIDAAPVDSNKLLDVGALLRRCPGCWRRGARSPCSRLVAAGVVGRQDPAK